MRVLELKEKNMDELIAEMAKDMINENEDYITKEVAEDAIKEIDKKEETKKNKKSKKGA